jgi:hypothetical protein
MQRLVTLFVISFAWTLCACQSHAFESTTPSAARGAAWEDAMGMVSEEAARKRIRDDGAPAPEAAEMQRKVIRTANVSLRVDDVDETGRQIESIANESGGFVLSSSRGNYHIKVPARGLDDALAAVEGLGEVTSRSLRGEDVTAEYVDLEVRLKNAHAARESYEALLRKAETVEEMLKVEQALHTVQERIELLEGRRKFLDEHLTLSDIHISLREERTRGPLQVLWDVVKWPFQKLWWW